MSLKKLFLITEEKVNTLLSRDDKNDDEISKIITDLQSCLRLVDSLNLFSSNEELDDVPTESLKYLSINYYLGKVNGQIKNLYRRKRHLEEANMNFHTYLQQCKDLRLFKDEAFSFKIEKPRNPEEIRRQKIEKFKAERETQKRLEALKKLINPHKTSVNLSSYTIRNKLDITASTTSTTIHSSSTTTTTANNNSSTADISTSSEDDSNILTAYEEEHEEEIRELYILQLQSYARSAVDELDFIKQELDVLEHMEELRELDELNIKDSNSNSNSNSSGNNASHMYQYHDIPGLPAYQPPSSSHTSSGIEITKTAKIGDQLIMKREVIKADVCKSRMAAPTMTIEEWGELERQRILEREQEARLRPPEEKPIRSYKQLEEAGEEDNEELVDQATLKDRAWDDWKDNVIKGSGNKLGKRF